jgi:hypothetical protein
MPSAIGLLLAILLVAFGLTQLIRGPAAWFPHRARWPAAVEVVAGLLLIVFWFFEPRWTLDIIFILCGLAILAYFLSALIRGWRGLTRSRDKRQPEEERLKAALGDKADGALD